MPDNGQPEWKVARGSYFYLSYAHSAPLADRDVAEADRDPWVRRLFTDLSQAVGKRGRHTPPMAPGFFDQDIPIGSDWKASLLNGLGAAQVLVPLYSPSYFARSWPGREWQCFHQRMAEAGIAEPLRRIVPASWAPLPRDMRPPGYRAALQLGEGEAAYVENGLQALSRLNQYRDAYDVIIGRLAARVVEIADGTPIPVSPPPDIDQINSPFVDQANAVFWIAVAVPESDSTRPDSSEPRPGSIRWRPYPLEPSLPAYVAGVAERLDFTALVTALQDRPAARSGPGVILIDPLLVADKGGQKLLDATAADLPYWVLPVLVLDEKRDAQTLELAERVRKLMDRASPPHARPVLRTVASVNEFVSAVPSLIAEAERRYLRQGPAPWPIDRAEGDNQLDQVHTQEGTSD